MARVLLAAIIVSSVLAQTLSAPLVAAASLGMLLPWPPLEDALPGQGLYAVNQGPNTCGSHCPGDIYNAWAYDFGLSGGQTVAAAHTGTAYRAFGDGNRGGFCDPADDIYANYVSLQLASNQSESTLYLHLQQNSLFVVQGQSVYQGAPLALSGNTGYTCGGANDETQGFHLHFALRTALGKFAPTTEVWFDDASVAASNGRPLVGNPPYRSKRMSRSS